MQQGQSHTRKMLEPMQKIIQSNNIIHILHPITLSLTWIGHHSVQFQKVMHNVPHGIQSPYFLILWCTNASKEVCTCTRAHTHTRMHTCVLPFLIIFHKLLCHSWESTCLPKLQFTPWLICNTLKAIDGNGHGWMKMNQFIIKHLGIHRQEFLYCQGNFFAVLWKILLAPFSFNFF